MIASTRVLARPVRILVAVEPDHARRSAQQAIGAAIRLPGCAALRRRLLREQRLVAAPVDDRRDEQSGGPAADGGNERAA